MKEQESPSGDDISQIEQIPEARMKTCTNCGIIVNEYEWFPIRGRTDEEDEFQVYPFCSEGCVQSWEESD